MKIRTIIAATCAGLAFSMAGAVSAHDGKAPTVTKNFEAVIPNIPGKSLIAAEVVYAPGAASASHTHAKSAFIYAYVISGAIESKVNDGETHLSGRRELVRTAGRDPFDQPQREQDRAGKAARRLRPRHQ
jgi:uncharacterized membrane protein YjjB (DUF3815 family)